jgi:hypothetical protein
MYFEVPKDLFKGFKQGYLRQFWRLSCFIDIGESIFDYDYILEFESKIEKAIAKEKGINCV